MLSDHVLPSYHHEHAPVAVFANSVEAVRRIAAEIADLIRSRQREGRPVVLGLATGSTPLALYQELIRLHREEGLSFAQVITFNLDEYYPLAPTHPQSYRHFMAKNLFDHIDIHPENTHLPSGTVAKAEVDRHCADYEEAIRRAGGIDLQILGIGRTGHIGFNEPGSTRRSATRLITLDPLTRSDASPDFNGEKHTPRYAITMGVRTILAARRVILMAWGQHKASIIRAAIEDDVTTQVTASFLQEHDNAVFVLDQAAAADLTRFRTPWLLGGLDEQGLAWDAAMTRRAILWLAQTKRKAILKLTDQDYNEAGLQDLVAVYGSAYETNLVGFYQMQHTITGWPGGRDPAKLRPGDTPVRALRGKSAAVFPKRILVLSPHPDDDVLSMGATLGRLVEQGHEVHVAHQVSGTNAVTDEELWRSLSFLLASGLAATRTPEVEEAAAWCSSFESEGTVAATPAVQRWKALLRQQEARAAARIVGVDQANVTFLNLPFYHSAAGRRRRLAAEDITAMRDLLRRVQPQLIFAAGDLDDPHGTHRLCLTALREACASLSGETFFQEAEFWLYRGIWTDWPLDLVDMAVPLSPQEAIRRREAIFAHRSQRNQTLLLEKGALEYWQRVEERSRQLATAYNELGLAEYEAIESFRRFSPEEFLRAAL